MSNVISSKSTTRGAIGTPASSTTAVIDGRKAATSLTSSKRNDYGPVPVQPGKGRDNITPRWLSVTIACLYSSMSDKTLMRYIKNGDIYGIKKGGKWYVDRLSMDDFMKSDDLFMKETLHRFKVEGRL